MSNTKIQNKLIWSISSFLIFAPLLLFAQVSDDFVVRTLVGSDTNPPTVPAPFTAVPIAIDQIDLNWGASTDDVFLSGYHVWRNNVQIATTTDTFYIDTGLIESTTYSYYVTAFDSSGNESASSTEIATTTLSSAVPSSSESGGTRTKWFENEPASLTVLPETDSATIQYETNDYIRGVIKWGRTTSYELGSSQEHAFLRNHETVIMGLLPETTYYFTIEGLNRYNKYGEIHSSTFTTLPAFDLFAPSNVTGLTAVRDGDDIELSWTNPSDIDFDKVRVVSNDTFYPSDIADGWVLYEGDSETTRDIDVPLQDSWKYYTVFSYDELGNISSGAVVRVYLGESIFDADEEDIEEVDPEKNDINLQLSDIIFSQDGNILEIKDNWSVTIDGSKQLQIEVPYEKVPEHLKTILVVLADKEDTDKVFKFLLRINIDKTAYSSILSPLGVNGTYPFSLSVFDFKTAQIGYTNGIIISQIVSISQNDLNGQNFILVILKTFFTSYLFWIILALIVILYMSRRLLRADW
jgi:hypothetical protein